MIPQRIPRCAATTREFAFALPNANCPMPFISEGTQLFNVPPLKFQISNFKSYSYSDFKPFTGFDIAAFTD